MGESHNIADTEKLRQQLENNVAKLQASLRHWQQWEIEYEGMKEEISALGDRHTRRDLRELENDHQDGVFSTPLLNAKERRSLLYDAKGKLRSASGVFGLLSRRVEYVQQNVKSVLSLLQADEKGLGDVAEATDPSSNANTALPLTEISETLDEEGKVISSAVSHPSEGQAEVINMLERGALDKSTNLMSEPLSNGESAKSQSDGISSSLVDGVSSHESETQDTEMGTSDSQHSDHETRKYRRPKGRKRVSFAEGTKAEHDPSEHPAQLPLETQMHYIQEACAQLRRQLARSITARNLGPLSHLNGAPQGSDADTAYQILRLAQNKEAKRLLKAQDIDLRGAARVLCKMAELNVYDCEDPQITNVIEEARELRSTASSSRESSPGAVLEALNGSNGFVNPEKIAGKRLWNDENESPSTVVPNGTGHTKEGDAVNGADISYALRDDDTPEEAALRRQMLAYNMDEVGSIVAEMEINDDLDDSDDDDNFAGPEVPMQIDDDNDNDNDDDDNDDDDDEEDEDDHGRSMSRVLSGKYIEEMRALEDTLKAKAMINSGPGSAAQGPASQDRHATKKQKGNDESKGVRFAENIEIKEISEGPSPLETPIVESTAPLLNSSATTSQAKKPSRFKASRAATKPESPSNEAKVPVTAPKVQTKGVPLGSRPIVEREVAAPTADAPEPEDADDVFLQQQVRNEYHRLRNNIVAKQGGFQRSGSDETSMANDNDISMADADAPAREGQKMSRFRAARLGLEQQQ